MFSKPLTAALPTFTTSFLAVSATEIVFFSTTTAYFLTVSPTLPNVDSILFPVLPNVDSILAL